MTDYGVADWREELGTQRARVRVEQPAEAVYLSIPWRLPLADMAEHEILVLADGSDTPIANRVRLRSTSAWCHLVFEATRAGTYFVYYLPYEPARRPGFRFGSYLPFTDRADPEWKRRAATTLMDSARHMPEATLVRLEARGRFSRFDPMEVVLDDGEVRIMEKRYPDAPVLLFPENRTDPIRMREHLPVRFIERGPSASFHGTARPGEYYAFQIGIWPAAGDIASVTYTCSNLNSDEGTVIPSAAVSCVNLEGTDWAGRPVHPTFAVSAKTMRPLWFGIGVPTNAAHGVYSGRLTLKMDTGFTKDVEVTLNVAGEPLLDHGDSDPYSMSRLRWMDSTLGLDEEVVAPYTPLVRDGRTIACLGRGVVLGPLGLPESIVAGRAVLARPCRFDAGAACTPRALRFTHESAARVEWRGGADSDGLALDVVGTMEFDGFLHYELTLTASREQTLDDVALELALDPAIAKYMIGLGRKGGVRPATWEWHWDQKKHQDSVWIGDWNAGVQCKLKGPDYRRPLVVHNYQRQPLLLPDAWHNDGRGGMRLEERDGAFVLSAFGGPRTLAAGQSLRFDFDLIITPVKPLDFSEHWRTRYYHTYVLNDVSDALLPGVTVINVHHGSSINPWINYPFLTVDALRNAVDMAHDAGRKLKIYYTVRELTNHAPELWMLRSLGNEVLADGPGGGYAWLQEHLRDGYQPNWYHHFPNGEVDAALTTTGLSRWHNHYIEGLDWLARNVSIDGIYIDDAAFDRVVLQRARKVLQRARPGSLIDFHSWNPYCERAGWSNSANQYLELFPYLSSIWFGESFKTDEPPDYWLVELSGVPFGVPGEMLDANNPFRGMLFGMTTRLPWRGDPRPVWKLWDDFGIADAEMLGWWDERCPVRTGSDDVRATVFARGDRALVVLASWADKPVTVELAWTRPLPFAIEGARLTAPPVEGIQAAAEYEPATSIELDSGSGKLLILQPKAR